MRQYTIEYKLHSADKVRTAIVTAMNKSNAYYKSRYEVIPKRENGEAVYSLWVAGYTDKNNKFHRFINTFEGNPF